MFVTAEFLTASQVAQIFGAKESAVKNRRGIFENLTPDLFYPKRFSVEKVETLLNEVKALSRPETDKAKERALRQFKRFYAD